MNDNDLERRLRSEPGPREQGYVPSQLPATVESGPPDGRPSRAMRLAVLVPAVVAGVAVVAVAAALLNGSGPDGVGAGVTSTPMPSPTERAPVYCQPNDVVITAEAVGRCGRLTRHGGDGAPRRGPLPVSVRSRSLALASNLRAAHSSRARRDGTNPTNVLQSGTQAEFSVTWSNWCGEPHDTVNLVVLSGGVEYPVDVPQGIGAMPPCMGENMPSTLSVTDLSPAP